MVVDRQSGPPSLLVELLKPAKDFVGPPMPPKSGKAANQNAKRRPLIVTRQRGITKGKGGSSTRIGIVITECATTVTALRRQRNL